MINFGEKYTSEELNARLKFFIGVILGLTLFGIVFVILYSLIFVTQPMNGMSPVDNKFFELIIPVATFLTGTLSGIMLAGDDKDARMKALDAATKVQPPSSPAAPRMHASPPYINNFSPSYRPYDTAGSYQPYQSAGDYSAQVIQGYGGKPAPVQPPHPEI